jgi:hypothetical protein
MVGSGTCLFSLLVSTVVPIWFIFSARVDGIIVRWDRRESGAGCEVETGSWGGASEPVLVLTLVTEAEDSAGWVNVV